MSAASHRHRAAALALALGLPLAGLATLAPVAGATTKVPKPTPVALARTCTRVADVLSDGPDPDADPIGYALAQIRPLREIETSDVALRRDIDDLASAYETVYKTNDKKGTQGAVNKAGKALDAICPGAF